MEIIISSFSCTFNPCPLGSDWQPRHQLLSMGLLVLVMWTPVLQQMNWDNTHQFTMCVVYPANWISKIHSELNNTWHWVEWQEIGSVQLLGHLCPSQAFVHPVCCFNAKPDLPPHSQSWLRGALHMGEVTAELLAFVGQPQADSSSQARAWQTQPHTVHQWQQNCDCAEFQGLSSSYLKK